MVSQPRRVLFFDVKPVFRHPLTGKVANEEQWVGAYKPEYRK